MAQIGAENAYLRKMEIDGFIIRLGMPELREQTVTMKRISYNENQIAKRLNESGHIYDADISDVYQEKSKILEQPPPDGHTMVRKWVLLSEHFNFCKVGGFLWRNQK